MSFTGTEARRIAEALGLQDWQSVTIRLEAGCVVQVTAARMIHTKQAECFASVLESMDFVLVEKKPADEEPSACPRP